MGNLHMRLGLLSDTHDHLANLQAAVQIFRREGVRTLIHCGDMTSPDTAHHLAGFEVVYLTGNMDTAAPGIRQALLALNPKNRADLSFSGEYGGIGVAATHGHRQDMLDELIRSGRHGFVFHGHTHRRRDEVVGTTRIINPGALGGLRLEGRSVCLLDLTLGEARFVDVTE